MRKIIFLDVDGVLNSEEFIVGFGTIMKKNIVAMNCWTNGPFYAYKILFLLLAQKLFYLPLGVFLL